MTLVAPPPMACRRASRTIRSIAVSRTQHVYGQARVLQQLAVTEDDALGPVGGAGAVNDHRRVVGPAERGEERFVEFARLALVDPGERASGHPPGAQVVEPGRLSIEIGDDVAQ